MISSRVRAITLSAALALATTSVSMNAGGRLEHRADMAVFALAVAWTIEVRYGWMIALAIVASANRESSVFLSLVWLAAQWAGTGPSRRLLVETVVLGIVATATVMGLRWGLGGTHALAGPDMPIGYSIRALRIFLRHPTPHAWPIALAGLFVLCAAALWDRPVTRAQGAMVIAATLMAGLSAIGGAAEELRIYIPAVTVAIVAGAAR